MLSRVVFFLEVTSTKQVPQAMLVMTTVLLFEGLPKLGRPKQSINLNEGLQKIDECTRIKAVNLHTNDRKKSVRYTQTQTSTQAWRQQPLINCHY
jgi:hypothetical protein